MDPYWGLKPLMDTYELMLKVVLEKYALVNVARSDFGILSESGAYNLGVATPRALVHAGDKTSEDARSWYMISEDAKSWVVIIADFSRSTSGTSSFSSKASSFTAWSIFAHLSDGILITTLVP
ncbi:hypothetical protein Tco_0635705 [Tanacetum coccineum]